MVVAFIGDDLHARSLRNNNHTNSDENKKIIAIFSKKKQVYGKFNKLVYMKDYNYLKKIYKNLDELIYVDILKSSDDAIE